MFGVGMFREVTRCFSFIVALGAGISHTCMLGVSMSLQISLGSKRRSVRAYGARISHTCMFGISMEFKTALCSRFVVTLGTGIS